MRDLLVILLSLSFLVGCSYRTPKRTTAVSFTARHVRLPVDTTVQSIASLNDYLLLLQTNGKVTVLDTSYKRVINLESKLATLNATFMFCYDDTLIIGNKDKAFYLTADFTPLEYKTKRRMYSRVLFEDSTYFVYGCCAGEWGGAVFFLNKGTRKMYSYFATCPNQVLRFGKDYVVCNNLAHLSYHMSFLIVEDPASLYEITDEKLKNHCNWYTTIDSLKDYWQVSKTGAVRFYQSYDAMSLVTFPYQDSLYSVLTVPKATVLALHRGDTTVIKDTLINRKLLFHEAEVIDWGNRKVCLFRLTGGSPVAAYRVWGNETGLIVVDDDRIDFLEKQNSNPTNKAPTMKGKQ